MCVCVFCFNEDICIYENVREYITKPVARKEKKRKEKFILVDDNQKHSFVRVFSTLMVVEEKVIDV